MKKILFSCAVVMLSFGFANAQVKEKVEKAGEAVQEGVFSAGQGVGDALQAANLSRPQFAAEVGARRVTKGNWLVGASLGSLGYSFEGKSFNINISPRLGYFIEDNLAVGAEVMAGFQTVKGADNLWAYGFSPFARYYFPTGATSTGRFFGHGSLGITGTSVGSDSETSFAFGVSAGYVHFITRTVGLEAMAGYNYSKSNLAGADKQSGLGVSVGFQIYLPGSIASE